MADDADQSPLLDIRTLITCPTVVIDGLAYEMRPPAALSIVESFRIGALGRRVDALASGEPSAKAGEELAGLIAEILAIVMPDLPGEILGRLSDAHRLAIVQVFIRLSRTGGTAGADAPGDASAGAKRPPGSSASMAATPTSG